MKPWALSMVAAFVVLGIWLRAWKSRSQASYWLRCWSLWAVTVYTLALAFTNFLQHLSSASAWRIQWADFNWQALVWSLSSFPLAAGLSLDMDEPGDDWSRTRLGFLAGLAFGPWIAEAFPPAQLMAFLLPLSLLAVLSRILKGPRGSWVDGLKAVALFNLLLVVYGLSLPAPWLGGLGMIGVLSFSLSPSGVLGGALAFLLAGLWVLLRSHIGLPLPGPASVLITVALTALGWWLVSIRGPRAAPH